MQNTKGTMDHLRDHQKYPATKGELVEACNKLSDFSDRDKKEFTDKLPDRTYNSAEEVIRALDLETSYART